MTVSPPAISPSSAAWPRCTSCLAACWREMASRKANGMDSSTTQPIVVDCGSVESSILETGRNRYWRRSLSTCARRMYPEPCITRDSLLFMKKLQALPTELNLRLLLSFQRDVFAKRNGEGHHVPEGRACLLLNT